MMGTVEFKQVFENELKRVQKIRSNKNANKTSEIADEDQLVGLALSGGGIRSAAFNLGILQSLANKGALARIDYLSTVSGGGYIGSALTWFLSKEYARQDNEADKNQNDGATRQFGTDADDHPLGRRYAGAKIRGQRDNERIDHIRSLGNYLRPTRDLGAGSAAALVLRNVVLAVLLWLFPLIFVLAALNAIGQLAFLHWLPDIGVPKMFGQLNWLYFVVPVFAFIAFLPMGKLSPEIVNSIEPEKQDERYFKQLGRQRHTGRFMSAALIATIIASLPMFLQIIHDAGGLGKFVGSAFSGGGVIATLYGILGGSGRPQTKDLVLKIGVMIVGVSLLLAAYWLALLAVETLGTWPGLGVLLVFACASFVIGANVGLNHLSLHRFYRDRLMETFLPDPSKEEEKGGAKWRPALRADKAALSLMCDENSRGPYHLINTNAILIGSEFTAVRNRGGENFVLSPLYVGSDRTNWAQTNTVYGSGASDKKGLQLSTAMSISGAAANPNSGPGGEGLTRSAIVSRLMMLLNIRLAYWIPNPNEPDRSNHWIVRLTDWLSASNKLFEAPSKSKRAVFTYPGVAALVGATHREDSGYLELSDGGHFENLGIYELIRRRLPLIIVSDAGQDEGFAFTDLSNAVRRVQVDFGVKIRFRSSSCDLDGIRPDPDEEILVGDIKIAAAKRGWAIAEIEYPKYLPFNGEPLAELPAPMGCQGYLVYLKPTMRQGLPSNVVGYRAVNASFPHQTTADQFFDEAQFEAYRELGYVTGKEMLVQCGGDLDRIADVPKA